MKKFIILAASAALVLGACSKNEVNSNETPMAVDFGTYVPKTITKAGSTAAITDDAALQAAGFGVFAYVTTGDYGSSKPNMMYNQLVEYSGSSWTYSPTKYWPNETGSTFAQSTAVQKVSFFAYAPHVPTATLTAIANPSAEAGIYAMSANTATTDPTISYRCSATAPVDLLWGVSSTDTDWSNVEGSTNELTAGLPIKNLVKPAANTKVKFLFKHALSKIVVNVETEQTGNQSQNISSDVSAPSGTEEKTVIVVRSLTIGGANVYNEGTLNLNNTTANTALWTVSGTAGTSFATDISSSEFYQAAKPAAWSGITATKGVADDAAELCSVMVIPTVAGTAINKVTIVYDVITYDTALDGSASVVENNIYKEISTTAFQSIAAGYVYTLNLKLGMRTIDVDASVDVWGVGGEENVDLPANTNS